MSDEATNAKRYRVRGRWVLAILAVSLMANVFFVGAKIGHGFRHDGGRERCARGDGIRSFVHDNKDVRELAKTAWRKKDGDFEEQGRAIQAASKAYVEALRAEPFEIEAVAAAQSLYQEEREAMRGVRDESVREFITQLSVEQRGRLADHMEKQAACKRDYWRRVRERRKARED